MVFFNILNLDSLVTEQNFKKVSFRSTLLYTVQYDYMITA